jgi:glyoxylate/hydroxypyruvate reductase
MTEFVTMCALSWHRNLPDMIEANAKREWRVFDAPLASERTIGIMGYGRMGTMVSAALAALGFRVKIWSKSPREGLPYPYYYGAEQLHSFAKDCDMLVCLLPLTQETEGIIDYDLLKQLNRGGCLINAARGSHLVEADLFRALDEAWLSNAYLDVLSKEPMPADDPIWERKNIIITYHCAAYISAEAGAEIIAGNIRSYELGNYQGPVYNPALGY